MATSKTGEVFQDIGDANPTNCQEMIAKHIIRMSSILPENSEIVIGKINWNQKNIGHRLYAVLSDATESRPGKELWVGAGWIQAKDGTGVIETKSGSSEKEVIRHLEKTLKSEAGSRKKDFTFNYNICSIKCRKNPVSAVVVATYKSEGW